MDRRIILNNKLNVYKNNVSIWQRYLLEIENNCEIYMGKYKDKYDIYYAIDYHILASYLNQSEKVRFSSEIKRHNIVYPENWMISNSILSGIFINNLLLLLPYKAELENSIESIIIKCNLIRNNIVGKIGKNTKVSFVSIKDILERKNAGLSLSDEEYKKVIKFIKNNYFDIFRLISMASFDCRGEVNNLFYNEILLTPEKPFDIDIHGDEFLNSADQWFNRLCDHRPGEKKRYANYLDGLALQYLFSINNHFDHNKENKMLILLTESSYIYKMLKKQSINLYKKIEKHQVSMIQYPGIFLSILLYAPTLTDCDIIRKEFENKRKFFENIGSRLIDLQKLFERFKTDKLNLSEIEMEIRDIEINIQQIQSLDMAKKDAEYQEKIRNYLEPKLNNIGYLDKNVKNNIDTLLDLIQSDEVFEGIKKLSDTLINDIILKSCEVKAWVFLKLRRYVKAKTPEIGYMIDFSDEVIRSIHERIIENKDIDNAINELIVIRKNNKRYKEHPEAILLISYLYEKDGKLGNAENELNCLLAEGISIEISLKIAFIRNMIIARKKDYREAIFGCDYLIENDPENARYLIQKSYFIWLSIREGRNEHDYSLKDAIDIMENAKILSSHNERWLKVIYFDLVIYYLDNDQIEEAELAFDSLFSLGKGGDGGIYKYAEAALFYKKGTMAFDDEKKKFYLGIAKKSIKEAVLRDSLNEFYNELKMILDTSD